MKKYLKKLLVVVMAVICACSVHVTVSALNEVNLASIGGSSVLDWLTSFLNPTTTTSPDDEETTTQAADDNTTTTTVNDSTTVDNPVSATGDGTVTTTVTNATTYNSSSYQYTYNSGQSSTELTTVTTTAVEDDEDDETLPFSASLTDLFEDDTAAVIVQTPTEAYTIGSALTVDTDDNDSSVPWQTIVLIAAAVLFIILAALVVALIIQRNKRPEAGSKANSSSSYVGSSENTAADPVIPEIMTPERIAELLGSATKSTGQTDGNVSKTELTSKESAAAIKNAALMSQLSHSYSDPLIRKYTDEPVVFSPQNDLNLDPDNATGADILKATDAMLDEITAGERYASDVSDIDMTFLKTTLNTDSPTVEADKKDISSGDVSASTDDVSASAEEPAERVCPKCGKPVSAGDYFCHNCGAYVE